MCAIFNCMDKTKLQLSNNQTLINDAVSLHNTVFNETKPSQYNNKEGWLAKISNGGYFVACTYDSKVVGYSVCDLTKDGDFKIWLVGVHPDFRKNGIWQSLYLNIKEYALSINHTHILLNTKPSQFPAMWSFLQKNKAEVYKREMTEDGEKYFLRIPIF